MDTNGHTSLYEDYVSFETAKLLKEKGFRHWCYKSYGDAVYHKGVPINFDEECELKSEGLEDEIEYVEGGYLYDFGCNNSKNDIKEWAAPTLWVAMKWLREVHKLHINLDIHWLYFANTLGWMYTVEKILENGVDYVSSKGDENDKTFYSSCEEACETAIKYCLENLI